MFAKTLNLFIGVYVFVSIALGQGNIELPLEKVYLYSLISELSYLIQESEAYNEIKKKLDETMPGVIVLENKSGQISDNIKFEVVIIPLSAEGI